MADKTATRQLGESRGRVTGNVLFEVALAALIAGGYGVKPLIEKLGRLVVGALEKLEVFLHEVLTWDPKLLGLLRKLAAGIGSGSKKALQAIIQRVESIFVDTEAVVVEVEKDGPAVALAATTKTDGTLAAASHGDHLDPVNGTPNGSILNVHPTGGTIGQDTLGPKATFNSDADPLRAIYGPARVSHPEEYQQALAELKNAGVEVDLRKGSMAYSPQKGAPGRMILDPDASVGALRHEMQHFRDAQAAGYPGIGPYLEDWQAFWRIEYRGYMQEVNFARSQGDYNAARQILRLMRQRKAELFERYGGTP